MKKETLPQTTGRPTVYSEELAQRIFVLLLEGLSLRKICQMEDMPAQSTVFRWLASPDHKEFCEQYARTREAQRQLFDDEIVDIADEATDNTNAQAVRVRVEARKYVASKMAPKKDPGDTEGMIPVMTVKVEIIHVPGAPPIATSEKDVVL